MTRKGLLRFAVILLVGACRPIDVLEPPPIGNTLAALVVLPDRIFATEANDSGWSPPLPAFELGDEPVALYSAQYTRSLAELGIPSGAHRLSGGTGRGSAKRPAVAFTSTISAGSQTPWTMFPPAEAVELIRALPWPEDQCRLNASLRFSVAGRVSLATCERPKFAVEVDATSALVGRECLLSISTGSLTVVHLDTPVTAAAATYLAGGIVALVDSDGILSSFSGRDQLEAGNVVRETQRFGRGVESASSTIALDSPRGGGREIFAVTGRGAVEQHERGGIWNNIIRGSPVPLARKPQIAWIGESAALVSGVLPDPLALWSVAFNAATEVRPTGEPITSVAQLLSIGIALGGYGRAWLREGQDFRMIELDPRDDPPPITGFLAFQAMLDRVAGFAVHAGSQMITYSDQTGVCQRLETGGEILFSVPAKNGEDAFLIVDRDGEVEALWLEVCQDELACPVPEERL